METTYSVLGGLSLVTLVLVKVTNIFPLGNRCNLTLNISYDINIISFSKISIQVFSNKYSTNFHSSAPQTMNYNNIVYHTDPN